MPVGGDSRVTGLRTRGTEADLADQPVPDAAGCGTGPGFKHTGRGLNGLAAGHSASDRHDVLVSFAAGSGSKYVSDQGTKDE
jgi:hypothetical protein